MGTLLENIIAANGTEGLNVDYVNAELSNGGGTGATAMGMTYEKDKKGSYTGNVWIPVAKSTSNFQLSQNETMNAINARNRFAASGQEAATDQTRRENQQISFQKQYEDIAKLYSPYNMTPQQKQAYDTAIGNFKNLIGKSGYSLVGNRVISNDEADYKNAKSTLKTILDENGEEAVIVKDANGKQRIVHAYDPDFQSIIDDAQSKVDKYELEEKTAKFYNANKKHLSDKEFTDDFVGQFGANFTSGQVGEAAFAAWSDYVKHPTEERRKYAEAVRDFAVFFEHNNRNALDDENVKGEWLSKDLARYLPQFFNQLKAQVKGGAVGAAAGSIAANPATVVAGAKYGATVATGLHSYDQMLGAAYQNFLDFDVDDNVKIEAAKNEALLSSLIESADTLKDFSMLGLDKLGIDAVGKVAGKIGGVAGKVASKVPVASILAKYGINAEMEGVEEFLQEGISVANENAVRNGQVLNPVQLLEEACKVYQKALKEKDSEEHARLFEARQGGARIGWMMGAPSTAVNVATNVKGKFTKDETIDALLGNKPKEVTPSKPLEEMSVEELNNYIDKLSRDGKDIREAQRIRNEKLRDESIDNYDESIDNYSSVSEQKAQATETASEGAETQTDEMTPATAQESVEAAKNELNSAPTKNEKVNEVIDALLPQTKTETKVNAEEIAEEERKALLVDDADVEKRRRAEFANELRSDPEVAERYKSGTGEFTGVPIKERLDTLREAFSDYDVDYYISDGEIVEARNGLEYDTDEALPDSREEREAYKDATVDLLTRTNREEPASHVGTNKTSQMRELEAEQKAAWEASERAKEKKYPIKPPSKNSEQVNEVMNDGQTKSNADINEESVETANPRRNDKNNEGIRKQREGTSVRRRNISGFIREGRLFQDGDITVKEDTEFTDSGHKFKKGSRIVTKVSGALKSASDFVKKYSGRKNYFFYGELQSNGKRVNGSALLDENITLVALNGKDGKPLTTLGNTLVHETSHFVFDDADNSNGDFHGQAATDALDGVQSTLTAEESALLDKIAKKVKDVYISHYLQGVQTYLAELGVSPDVMSAERLAGLLANEETVNRIISRQQTSELSVLDGLTNKLRSYLVSEGIFDENYFVDADNVISSLSSYSATSNFVLDDMADFSVRDAEEQRQRDEANYKPEEDDSWRSSATYEQSERFAEQDQKEAAEKAERDKKEAWENAQREFGAQHKDIVDASKKTTKAVSDFLGKNFSDVEEKDTSRIAQRDALNEYSAAVEHIGDGTLSHNDFQTYYTTLEENPRMADFFDEDTAKLLGTVIERGNKANETANPADVESYRKVAAEFSRKLHDSTQKAVRAIEDKKSFSDNITQNKSSNEFFNNASAFFNRWLKNPDAQFRFFGSYNAESNSSQYQTAEGINNAVRKDTSIRTRAAAIAAKMTSKAEYVDFARGKTKSNVKVDGYTLSMSEAVSYAMTYNTLKAQGGNYRVENAGGWVFNNKVSKVADVHHLYNECMKAIDSDPMAKEFMEVATEVFDYLSPFMKEASYRINGYETDMYSKGNYFPVIYGDGTAKSNQRNTQEVFDNRHFNERTKKAGGYINIRNAADVMSSYTNSAVNTIAWGELGQRLQMMNKDTALGDGISSQVGALNNEYAIWMNNYINQMNGITDYTNESNGNKALRWARQHFTQGTLMFSPTVPIKQVSSYWSAAGMLDFDVLAKTYRPKFGSMLTGKKGVDNIIEQSRLSGSLNPEISGGTEPAWFSKAKAKCKLLNQLANLTNIEDYGTIDNLYAASINQVMKNEPNLDTESTEFQEKVDDLFSEVVIRTQPIFTTRARAEYLTTNNEVVRLFSNFRTQQTQNLGNIATAIGEYQAAKANGLDVDKASKKLKNTLAGQAASYVSFAALGVIADMAMHKFKKYDKDEDDEEYDETKGTIGNISTEKVILNAIGKLGSAGFGTVPFGSDLWNLAYSQITRGEVDDFYGIGIGPLSTLEQSAKALGTFGKNLADGKFNPKEAYNALRYTTQAAGMPIHNLYLPVNAIVQYARDIADKEDRGMYDDLITEINDQVKADRKLRDAYESEVKAVGRAESNGDKYTGWRTFEEAGIGYDDWLAAKNKYTELSSDKELSAGNKADRFNVWLRQQGYDDKHREFIQEEFGFYSQVRGESDKLDTWVALGLDSERALNFKDSISAEEARVNKANEGITNDDLKQHYRNIDKMMTVANAKATDKELDILAPEILGKNALGLYEVARDNGMSGKQAVQAFKELDTSEDSKAQQAEVYAYYKAHPELESFAIAIWNAYGWKTSWQAYKRKQK